MKRTFIVKNKNPHKQDKHDDTERNEKAVMEEDVPEGENADRLILESKKPIDLQRGDGLFSIQKP